MQSFYHGFQRYASAAAIVLLSLIFDGCADHQLPPPPTAPTGDFSDDIKQVISQDNLNKIRELGVNICEGKNVGNLEGIFLTSPNILQKTTVPNDAYSPGDRFVDYRYRIKNQDATKLTAEVDYKGISLNTGNVVDEANGKTAFLSGNGNCFTLFVIVEGRYPNGTRYRSLDVYSGEKTSQGVSNFQNAILMLEDYGDPFDDLIPVNSGRAFKDNDGFSESQSTFRKAAPVGNEEGFPKTYLKK